MLWAKVLWSLVVFWHSLAFAAGCVNVFLSYRALFAGNRNPAWSEVIRSAEWQLWLSGFAIVGSGMVISGWQSYLVNPKLWTKSLLVVVWLLTTLVIRYVAVDRLRAGQRQWMLWAGSVSTACWLYGAYLGVAKTLANGAAPFVALAGGFLITIFGCLSVTFWLEHRYVVSNKITCRFNLSERERKHEK